MLHVRVQIQSVLEQEIQQDAAAQRYAAHDERNVHAMPQPEAELRRLPAQHRGHRTHQQRLHRQHGQHAHQQACGHQHLHRNAHPYRRLVRRFLDIQRPVEEEHVMDEAQRIAHAEHPAQHRRKRQDPLQPAAAVQLQRLAEEHLLGQEAVDQRHARHRGRRYCGEDSGVGHVLPQPVDAAHVARAGLVLDDAGGHEQRRLERGVIDDVEQRRHRAQRRADAQQQGDQAEVAHCRVGEQALQIVAEDRLVGAERERHHTHRGDRVEPGVRPRQHRIQAGEQEDAGLHHGGGVQIGRHRRRCSHGARQPEMERELRRLGEGAGQDQRQDRQIQRASSSPLRRKRAPRPARSCPRRDRAAARPPAARARRRRSRPAPYAHPRALPPCCGDSR